MEHDDLAPGNSGCACDAAPGASTALVLAGGGALGAY